MEEEKKGRKKAGTRFAVSSTENYRFPSTFTNFDGSVARAVTGRDAMKGSQEKSHREPLIYCHKSKPRGILEELVFVPFYSNLLPITTILLQR